MTDNHNLDVIDRQLLDIIQTAFPITERPYAELGIECGISEADAFERIKKMRDSGVIRRIGANFQSSKLGFVSTLCAAKVDPEHLDSFIKHVNAIDGVTHNYERKNIYNIWFTLISQSREQEKATLAKLSAETGINILNLPAIKLFKIRVDFSMSD